MKHMELPHVTAYQINPKEDELILEKKDYKKKVKYLQELIGKLNYIRSRDAEDWQEACDKETGALIETNTSQLVDLPKRLVQHPSKFGLYFRYTETGLCMVALYVDDLLISSEDDEGITEIKEYLSDCYKMKELGFINQMKVYL
ncbi:hypothetical protein C6P44_004861 [Monosporozyma unispora]|nr:hypothetical protein C6P44_004861 [Kazachstania unispora]